MESMASKVGWHGEVDGAPTGVFEHAPVDVRIDERGAGRRKGIVLLEREVVEAR